MPIYGGAFSPTHGQCLGTVNIAGYSFPLEIVQLNWTGAHRDPIEVSSMNVQPTTGTGIGNKQHIPSAYVEPGMLELTVNHNPTVRIPITDPSKSGPTVITFNIGPAFSSQESFQAYGFVTDYSLDGPMDGKALTASVKIKLTDVVDNSYPANGAIQYSLAS